MGLLIDSVDIKFNLKDEMIQERDPGMMFPHDRHHPPKQIKRKYFNIQIQGMGSGGDVYKFLEKILKSEKKETMKDAD